MNDRTLDQALDMTPAERAELRARVEKLARQDGCPDCGLEHDVAECNGAQCDCCDAIEREASQ